MSDIFAAWAAGLEAPASHAAAVTPNDAADINPSSRAIYIGTGGDLKVTLVGGETVTFAAVPGGTLLPLRVSRVWATGSTASNVVAVW